MIVITFSGTYGGSKLLFIKFGQFEALRSKQHKTLFVLISQKLFFLRIFHRDAKFTCRYSPNGVRFGRMLLIHDQ